MKKIISLCILISFVFGTCMSTPTINRKLQREIFMECLKNTLKGTARTSSTNWDEIIWSCERASYRMSQTE